MWLSAIVNFKISENFSAQINLKQPATSDICNDRNYYILFKITNFTRFFLFFRALFMHEILNCIFYDNFLFLSLFLKLCHVNIKKYMTIRRFMMWEIVENGKCILIRNFISIFLKDFNLIYEMIIQIECIVSEATGFGVFKCLILITNFNWN